MWGRGPAPKRLPRRAGGRRGQLELEATTEGEKGLLVAAGGRHVHDGHIQHAEPEPTAEAVVEVVVDGRGLAGFPHAPRICEAEPTDLDRQDVGAEVEQLEARLGVAECGRLTGEPLPPVAAEGGGATENRVGR